MTEIEPIVENVRVGDVVTYETGKPGEAGYTLSVHRVDDAPISTDGIALATVRGRARGGYYRITKIYRPAPPVPTTPGERFWAIVPFMGPPREFIVTDEGCVVDLTSGNQWGRQLSEERFTVVPAPEPETVPVPAHLIREAVESRTELSDAGGRASWVILSDIVQAVREREEADDE